MENTANPFQDILSNWPHAAQTHFCTLRDIVHDAAKVAKIGGLTETLKWGEPAWLPATSGIGSTLRASWSLKRPKLWVYFLTAIQRFLKQCAPFTQKLLSSMANDLFFCPLIAPSQPMRSITAPI